MKLIKFSFFIITLILNHNIALAQNIDAVTQKLEKHYVLNEDGSTDLRVIKEVKLISHLSMSKFGETFILYNPTFQKLTINSAYTKTADGKVINAPKNAYNELLPAYATSVAAFNHLKEMAIVHTGTELGATIFVDYTIHSSKEFAPALMGEEIIGDIVPITEFVLSISCPVGKSINYKLLNSSQLPVKSVQGSQERLVWKFVSLKPLSSEQFQPRIPANNPYISFSSQTTSQISEWLNVNISSNQNLPVELVSKIDQINKNYSNELSKITQIQRLISNEITTSNVPFAMTSFKARSIDEVWTTNSGTNYEKSLIFAKSLNYAQIIATPILCFDKNCFDSKIGNLKAVSDILVSVTLANGDKMVLNPMQNSPFDRHCFLENKTAFEIKTNGSNFDFPNRVSTTSLIGVIDWNPEKRNVDYSIELVADNALNPCFEVINDTNVLKKVITGISPNEVVNITSFNMSNTNMHVKFEISKQLEPKKDKYFFLELPSYKNDIDSWNLPPFIQSRVESFEIPFPISVKQTFVIKIPNNYKLVNNELNKKISNNCGEIELKIVSKGNQIEVTRVLKLSKKIILQNEYLELRELYSKWQQRSLKTIIIVKIDEL